MAEKKFAPTNKSILLFESDSGVVSFIQKALSAPGLSVEPARNVFSGIKLLKTTPPDFIIAHLDYHELSGLDLLKKVRDFGYTVPFILYGPKSDDIILDAFRSGATDYWTKPLDAEDIRERIESILSKVSNDAVETQAEAIPETLAKEKNELQGLLKISSCLNITGDTKVSLNLLTDLAAEIMRCEAASIMLINDREQTLEFVVASGEKKQKLETINIPLGEGIAGWVALHRKAQIVNDTRKDKRFTGIVDSESGFVTRQIIAVPMILDSEIIGVLEVVNSLDKREFNDDDLRILDDIAERLSTVIAATRKIENQQNYYVQTTNIIVKAIEKKDIYAEGHSWKVAEYCHKIALALDLSKNERNDLHFGALLHDIGKLNLPSHIFHKRVLNEREKELLRQHPIQGAKILEPINLWKTVVPFVLYHHEAWDGNGYPFSYSGDAIPLGARIINLAEAFTVMRSSTTYKKQMTMKETILEIMRFSGRQFDPEIVKIFMQILEKEHTPK